jgi:hypothetical protein
MIKSVVSAVFVLLALVIFAYPAVILGYVWEIIRVGFTTGQGRVLQDLIAAENTLMKLIRKKQYNDQADMP